MALIKAKQLDATDNYTFNSAILTQTIPTLANQAATKQYVDNVAQGLDTKQSCRVGTTANIDLSSAPATIDGVTLATNDRVLVKDQTDGTENGIYIFAGTGNPMTRSEDADNLNNSVPEVTANMYTFIEEGTANGDSGWVLITDNPITLGTTSLTFTQFSGAGTVSAGVALEKIGSTFNVLVDGTSIDVNGSNQLEIAAGGVTNSKVATGIDAAKIADGSVSNTEFQYINSLTSNAQTQFNNLASAIGSAGPAGIIDYTTNHYVVDATSLIAAVSALDAALFQEVTDLASTANGLGASLIGIEDAGNYFTSTNVEGALQEIGTQLAGAGNIDSRLDNIEAVIATTTGLAGVNFTSNHVVTDGTSLQAAISALDAFFGNSTTSDLNKLHDITSTATQIDTAVADAHTRAYEVLTVTSNGQTAFTLSNAATTDGTVELSVNGQGQLNGVDYTVSGTSVTWNDVDFTLATTDKVVVVYDVAA